MTDGEEDKRLGLLLPVIALGMLKYMSVNIVFTLKIYTLIIVSQIIVSEI